VAEEAEDTAQNAQEGPGRAPALPKQVRTKAWRMHDRKEAEKTKPTNIKRTAFTRENEKDQRLFSR